MLLKERGPDDFISSCLEKDMFQCVILDEARPFFLKTGSKTEQVYILVVVKLVTYPVT